MSNVLETSFSCQGSISTVATIREPGESLADLVIRHDARVADAKKDCGSLPVPLPPIQTAWRTAVGNTVEGIIYASPTAYGQAAHDADVATLQNKYPPVTP